MTDDVQFDFGGIFQTKVIAMMIRDADFLKKFVTIVKPAYFENSVESALCSVCLSYHEIYQIRPTIDAVWEFLKSIEGAKWDAEKETLYADKIDEVKFVDVADGLYVSDRILDFVRCQSMKIAILESAEVLHRRDKGYLETIMKKIDVASKVTSGVEDIGLNYFPTVEDRLLCKHEKYREIKVPTLIRSLDASIGGGLSNGEIGIIMASTNRGKSMMLTVLGKSGVFLGKRVVHYSMEMSDIKIAMRYDSCFTGRDRNAIYANTQEAIDIVTGIGKRFGSSLIIKKYPTGTASVATLRSHLSQLDAQGLTPDLIIVDYGDIMRPTRNNQNDYAAQGEIFEGLRGIASERNVPLWSATQTTRGATSKRIITIEDVADSFEKIRVADLVVTMCQTEDEQRLGQMRLFVAKNRDNAAYQTIDISVDWARVHMAEMTDQRLGDSAS